MIVDAAESIERSRRVHFHLLSLPKTLWKPRNIRDWYRVGDEGLIDSHILSSPRLTPFVGTLASKDTLRYQEFITSIRLNWGCRCARGD